MTTTATDALNADLAAEVDHSRRRADKIRKELAARLTNGQNIDEWHTENLVRAQATADLWHSVQLNYELHPECRNHIDAVRVVAADAQQGLLRMSHASRSTSTFTNAFEDAQRDAIVRFLTDGDVQKAVKTA